MCAPQADMNLLNSMEFWVSCHICVKGHFLYIFSGRKVLRNDLLSPMMHLHCQDSAVLKEVICLKVGSTSMRPA